MSIDSVRRTASLQDIKASAEFKFNQNYVSYPCLLPPRISYSTILHKDDLWAVQILHQVGYKFLTIHFVGIIVLENGIYLLLKLKV